MNGFESRSMRSAHHGSFTHRRRPLLLGLSLSVLAAGIPAQAGSSTAGSIISKADAIATASSAMPAGQVITAVQCLTMVRDLSPRYSCTVTWGGRR